MVLKEKVKFPDFDYLKQSECFTVNSINDLTTFIDINQSLQTICIFDFYFLNNFKININIFQVVYKLGIMFSSYFLSRDLFILFTIII